MTASAQDLMVHPIEWHLLAPLYEQRHRVYHDTLHIHSVLQRIDGFDGITPDQAMWLEAVAWLHDAYYDPLAAPGVNERRSADLLASPLGAAFTPAGLALAKKTILATAHHLEDQQGVPFLVGLFLDMDMGNLSDNLAIFCEQSVRVSQELIEAGVPRDMVQRGQSMFAERMLARQKIYYTPHFQAREKDARANLEALHADPGAFLPYDPDARPAPSRRP